MLTVTCFGLLNICALTSLPLSWKTWLILIGRNPAPCPARPTCNFLGQLQTPAGTFSDTPWEGRVDNSGPAFYSLTPSLLFLLSPSWPWRVNWGPDISVMKSLSPLIHLWPAEDLPVALATLFPWLCFSLSSIFFCQELSRFYLLWFLLVMLIKLCFVLFLLNWQIKLNVSEFLSLYMFIFTLQIIYMYSNIITYTAYKFDVKI